MQPVEREVLFLLGKVPCLRNIQDFIQLKRILIPFILFHARVPCFLIQFFCGTFINVIKLTLERSLLISGRSSFATENDQLHQSCIKDSCFGLCQSNCHLTIWYICYCPALLCQLLQSVCQFTCMSSTVLGSTRPNATSLLNNGAQ